MTAGELARLYVGEFGIEVDLHVVPMEGWSRDMTFDVTGLPWVAPSPNMPTVESALAYPGNLPLRGDASLGRQGHRRGLPMGRRALAGRGSARRGTELV